jgi:hypothetical protein
MAGRGPNVDSLALDGAWHGPPDAFGDDLFMKLSSFPIPAASGKP